MGGRTLLDDGNMLLCGGHLYGKSMLVMLFSLQSEREVYSYCVGFGELSFVVSNRRSLGEE
jgi:hypothetical protein